ncbi:MAG: hypothetical protein APR63_08690 [Desulfuromonas sp. SDB]|nr:MAG: hypothetical protein APR63_08690 [Desulfuromonas sp. SDB]
MSRLYRKRILFLILFFIGCSQQQKTPHLKVVYMFDDNNITDYIIVFNFFESLEQEYNIELSATTFVIVKTINKDSNYCNLDQLLEMQNNNWEIASHTMNHPIMTLLTEQEIRYELKTSRDSLFEMGFYPSNFAFPCGVCNERIRNIASEYYKYVRDTDDRFWEKPLDFTHLGCFVVPSKNSVESTKRRIELALIRNEDYVFILFHRLGYNDKEVTPENFKRITELLITKYNLYPMSFKRAVLSDY